MVQGEPSFGYEKRDHQRPSSINVLCGIIGNTIISPHYRSKICCIFTEHYASSFRSRTIRNSDANIVWHITLVRHIMLIRHVKFLTEYFVTTGRGSIVNWTARSPDRTPPDFYLWGTLKEKFYTDVPTI